MFTVYILNFLKLEGFYLGFTLQLPKERLFKHLHSNKGHTAKVK